jgi:hypothetical protein
MCDRRFNLRTWLAIVAAWGVLFAWTRSQGSPAYALIVVSHSIIAWAVCLGVTFAFARHFGPFVSGSFARAIGSGLFAAALLVSLYLVWGHDRAMFLYHTGLDHHFPFPDPAINALERWFDARRPVSRGSLKLHGEYPMVGFVLGMLVIAGVSVSGFLLGVLSRPSEAAGSECGAAHEV